MARNKQVEVARLSATAVSAKELKKSVISYYLGGPVAGGTAPYRLACPDTNVPPDGLENVASGVCVAINGSTPRNIGVVPWRTLGISLNDAIDAYGNYYTYVVSAVGLNSCKRVTNSYDGTQTFIGSFIEPTDTESVLTSQAIGSSLGETFSYAFISHGENGLGAISSGGTMRAAPTSAKELENCPLTNTNCAADAEPLAIFSGPKQLDTGAANYFDDTVFLSDRTELGKMCEDLTPSGEINADINQNFTDTTIGGTPSTLDATVGAGVTVQLANGSTTNKVLQFTGANAAIAAASNNYDPLARPNYISFTWRPTVFTGSDRAGISLGLRATSASRDSAPPGNIFNAAGSAFDGITVQLYETNAGTGDNHITICDETNSQDCFPSSQNITESAGLYALSNLTTYQVEAYDDGVQIWARIYDVANPATSTATVALTTISSSDADLGGQSSIFLMGFPGSTSEIDDLTIGRAAIGVSFDGTNDYIDSGADVHDTSSGSITLEAWVKPDTIPSSARAALISKWTQAGGTTANQAYRLYLDSGALKLDIAGLNAAETTDTTETINFGSTLTTGTWTHVAATYDKATRSANLYLNGARKVSTSGSLLSTNFGIQNDATVNFTVGANASGTDPFDGTITDVRVWSTVRSTASIVSNFRKRLQLSGTLSGLIVNWPLDRDGDAVFGTTPVVKTASNDAGASPSAGGETLTNGARYTPILQTFLPPFSDESFCTAGTFTGPYSCDYRTIAQSGSITIPNNLNTVFAKAWGGGGGGYLSGAFTSSAYGGGGGMAAGRLKTINSVTVANMAVRVDTGSGTTSGGTGSAGVNNGAGGGAPVGVWRDVDSSATVTAGDFAGVIAGGGGGASYADDNVGGGINCNFAGDCGPGGGGGGGTSAPTSRAPDDGNNFFCGGRGGDNSPTTTSDPPRLVRCPSPADPGQQPTNRNGGGGAGAAGGTSVIGSGGAGYNGAGSVIGSGGGGGGVSNSGMTLGGGGSGGYGSATGGTDNMSAGFGGGGGSGFSDSATLSAFGVAGSALNPGNVTGLTSTNDPDWAPTYCNAGANCIVNPGQGGQIGNVNGKRGVVILKW